MENLIGIILFVLVVFSLLRGFMLYPRTKDSFGMGKEYSSTTSTICGLLYIVVLIGLLADSWVEISVVCLIATIVLQLRPLIRAGNVQAMARVMGGGYLPWKDDLLLSPLHTWYLITLTGIARVAKVLMHVTVVGIPFWKQYEDMYAAGEEYISYSQQQKELRERYHANELYNEAREIARELNQESKK
ncbi:MAG: hypothetical protein LIO78_07310 [Clostridiales bacterium]|nr:hypothetical protein [Clostridiales bacterium]